MRDGQRPVRAVDRAYAHLRDHVLRGTLAPGTMLSENELAASLSMSRTPIRGALTRLQEEGWVTIYPKRGALVRELSQTELNESAAVRHALESAGIQRGSATRRSELADLLAENVHSQQSALDAGDFTTFTTLAMQFHRTFVEMADNATMLQIYDRLQDRQYVSIMRSAGRINDNPAGMLDEHRALVEDARRGDWSAFATHLNDHQTRHRDDGRSDAADC